MSFIYYINIYLSRGYEDDWQVFWYTVMSVGKNEKSSTRVSKMRHTFAYTCFDVHVYRNIMWRYRMTVGPLLCLRQMYFYKTPNHHNTKYVSSRRYYIPRSSIYSEIYYVGTVELGVRIFPMCLFAFIHTLR